MNPFAKAGAAVLLLASGLLLSACAADDDHNHPQLTTGEALFNYHCERCHGRDGTGDWIDQIPANILTQRGRGGVIEYITTATNPQREMPVFSMMPYEEAAAIANHLFVLRQQYNEAADNKRKPSKLMFEAGQ